MTKKGLMSLEATEVPHSASLVALPIVFMLHPCLSDLDSQKQKTRVEVSQLTSQPQCLTDSVWAGFFASKSPEGKRSNGHNDDEWSSETVTGRSRFVEGLSPIFCIIKNPYSLPHACIPFKNLPLQDSADIVVDCVRACVSWLLLHWGQELHYRPAFRPVLE